jgi:GNAT superfamily N-acetyltransferase
MWMFVVSPLLSVTGIRKEAGMQSTIYAADYVRNQDPETNVVRVRPASPEDQEGLRRMLSCLSRESVYLRFHAPLPRAPEWAAAMFANSDRRYGESLVAVADGEVVGHAMYVRLDAGDSAEFAIVVEDRCQARGIGKLLLSALAERAGREGVKSFTGAVLGENRPMFDLVRSVFERVRYAMEDGAYAVSVTLPDSSSSPLELSA